MYQYPYGDSQQLNLDWIINKLIELEQSFVAGESAELEQFANALISLTYIPTQAYNNSDIVFHNGHLYRCNTTIPAPGEVWDPSHWDQIMLGNTVANLVRAVAGMNSDNVFNESNVSGTHVTEALNALVEDIRYNNHKIQQKKNGAYTDVIPVEDTPSNNSDRLASSKAAYDLKGAITSVESKTTRTLVTPSIIGTKLSLISYDTTVTNGFCFGSIVLKYNNDFTAADDATDYIQMPFTKAAYGFQPAIFTSGQWNRDAVSVGRAYFPTNGKIHPPAGTADQYVTITVATPVIT